MKFVRKGLIWVHRYLGIALSLLFVVWFLSGIGIVFAGGMPRLNLQERLLREPPIDLSLIKLSPSEARAGDGSNEGSAEEVMALSPRPIELRALLDRPVYHVD